MTQLAHIGSFPAEFPGTEEEKVANHNTHIFMGEGKCGDCDRRQGSISADWPCGAPVPRVELVRK